MVGAVVVSCCQKGSLVVCLFLFIVSVHHNLGRISSCKFSQLFGQNLIFFSIFFILFFFLQNGLECTWMDTRDVLVVSPTSTNQVDPNLLQSETRLEKWYSNNPSKMIIATGFIASTPDNIPTTLKRDGSDFSAAIMGALLRARRVTIWTDVDGVYSADPRKGLFKCYIYVFFLNYHQHKF